MFILFKIFLLLNIKQERVFNCDCNSNEPCYDIYGNCHGYEHTNFEVVINNLQRVCPSYTIDCNYVNSNNIIKNSKIIPSSSKEDSDYSINYINDDDVNSFFATGLVDTPSFIYINLTHTFSLLKLEIVWNIQPPNYSIFISNSCNIDSNFTKTVNGDVLTNNLNYSCNNWKNIYNHNGTIDYSYINTKSYDFCSNFSCSSLDDLIMNQILIEVYDSGGNIFIIPEIIGYGLDVYNQVTQLYPNNIPKYYSSNFTTVLANYNNQSNIFFGNDDCTVNYYNFTIKDGLILINTNEIIGDAYFICYTYDPNISSYYPQSIKVNVSFINYLENSNIHLYSYTQTTINSTNYLNENYVFISSTNSCYSSNSIVSLNDNQAILYDSINLIGTYSLCYSTDMQYWEKSDYYISIINSEISAIYGCTDNNFRTSGCPTEGGNEMTLVGTNFEQKFSTTDIVINIGPFQVSNIKFFNTTAIIFDLPEGNGMYWDIKVLFSTDVIFEHSLSYSMPYIEYIQGCTQSNVTVYDCSNDYANSINIIGTNFGDSDSKVLIGSDRCENVIHNSDKNITCNVSGNRGTDKSVYVIQKFGTISDGKNLLSFKECEKGKELNNGSCNECSSGYFKGSKGDTDCLVCIDGYYQDEIGSSGCKQCYDNSVSNMLKTGCLCKEGYYLYNNECHTCDNSNFYGDLLYYCDSEGLTLETLVNYEGYWRESAYSTEFYECEISDLCPSNQFNNTFKCKDNHEGVLCHSCIDNYATDSDGYCQECPSNSNRVVGLTVFYFILAIFLTVFFLVIVFLHGKKILLKFIKLLSKTGIENVEEIDDASSTESEESEEDIIMEFKDEQNILKGTIQQKIKILITYIQLLYLLTINLNIKWPNFLEKIINGFDFITLDVFGISNEDLNCTIDTGFYNKFIFYMLLIPIIILLNKVALIIVQCLKKEDKNIVNSRYIYTNILIVYMLYSPSTDIILKIYKCKEIENEWYLSADLSEKCYDDKWITYAILGGIFTLVYVIGIPLYFHRLLTNNRSLLNDKSFSYKYGFLFQGYKNEFYFFETIEMTKKIILMATVIYLDESPTRIMIAMVIVFFYTMIVCYYQPINNMKDNFLNIIAGSELFLLLLMGLILEVKINVQDSYNEFAFNGFVFFLIFSVLFLGNYQLFKAVIQSCICEEKCHKKLLGCIRRKSETSSEGDNIEMDIIKKKIDKYPTILRETCV